MNTKYVDFIGMYDNVFPDGFCSHLISEFEMMMNRGLCGNRQDFEGMQKTEKQDYFIGLNLRYHAMNDFNGKIESGELVIEESINKRLLPAGIFSRWSKNEE